MAARGARAADGAAGGGVLPSRTMYVSAFRRGLKEAGFVEGQDVATQPARGRKT
jgi:hypothetical protein